MRKRYSGATLQMFGEEHTQEWVKENIKLCPIGKSLDLICKKFAVLILRNMTVYKHTRFNQLMDTIDGINPKTLTARLRELERSGLIRREVYPEVPPRVEYFLTQKGMSLKTVLEQLAVFSIQNYGDRIFVERSIDNKAVVHMGTEYDKESCK
jgi:DNA-binding HxlR family transcriptional regulator